MRGVSLLLLGERVPSFERQPVFGLPVQVPDPEGRPVALVFLRSLGCPLTREAVFRMQDREGDFHLAGARLAAFTPSPLAVGRDFVPRNHLLYPLVCDPAAQGEPLGPLYRAWQVGRDTAFRRSLVDLPGTLASRRVLRQLGTVAGRGFGPLAGPPDLTPAAFLVDGKGRLAWVQYGSRVYDLPDIPGLLAAVP